VEPIDDKEREEMRNFPVVDSSLALESLKVCIGLLGRADFLTGSYHWPGDLIYPDERLVVFVDSCYWHNCPKHTFKQTPWVKFRIKRALSKRSLIEDNLKSVDWTVYSALDCEVKADPQSYAAEIVSILDSCKRKKGNAAASMNDLDLANLARIDAASRVNDKAWREFVYHIAELYRLPRKGSKFEVERHFIEEKGWKRSAFETIWNCAFHHEVIARVNMAWATGPLHDACMVDCGHRPRKDRNYDLSGTDKGPRDQRGVERFGG
jgi:G:T-mismatch repair DNA endonuclease (very short patch repair protein)